MFGYETLADRNPKVDRGSTAFSSLTLTPTPNVWVRGPNVWVRNPKADQRSTGCSVKPRHRRQRGSSSKHSAARQYSSEHSAASTCQRGDSEQSGSEQSGSEQSGSEQSGSEQSGSAQSGSEHSDAWFTSSCDGSDGHERVVHERAAMAQQREGGGAAAVRSGLQRARSSFQNPQLALTGTLRILYQVCMCACACAQAALERKRERCYTYAVRGCWILEAGFCGRIQNPRRVVQHPVSTPFGGFWMLRRIQNPSRAVQHPKSTRFGGFWMLRQNPESAPGRPEYSFHAFCGILDAAAESSIRAGPSNIQFPHVLRDSGCCGRIQHPRRRIQNPWFVNIQQFPAFFKIQNPGRQFLHPPLQPPLTE